VDRLAVALDLAGVAVLYAAVALAGLMHVSLQQLLPRRVCLPLSLRCLVLLSGDGGCHGRHRGHREEGHERDKEGTREAHHRGTVAVGEDVRLRGGGTAAQAAAQQQSKQQRAPLERAAQPNLDRLRGPPCGPAHRSMRPGP
jgi:hypothetical protein